MNRKEKEQIISDFNKKIEGYKAVVLTHYRGLNVDQMNHLRKRLREEKVSYHVIKNTLMRLASKGTDLEKLGDYFEGPTAIAISYGDPILLAKVLLEFIKTQPPLEIKVGLIEGRVAPPEEVKALATMPSREVLLAQILGEIQTSGGQVMGAILSVLQQMLGVIQARVDQLAESTSPVT
ncbi:MAG: 50S ribosomal protein L10 [Desulfobacterales bacterium]|nr:50S ribosomal protein L10 [Desulfobacterales bacterium]